MLFFSYLSVTRSAKYEWKIVKLKEVEVISYDTIRQIFNGQLARATGEEEYLQQVLQQIQVVKQCIDIVYKNAALFSGMKLLGRSDRLFYFPEATQQDFRNSGLLSRDVLRNCTNPQAQAIYAGLKTAIQINRRDSLIRIRPIPRPVAMDPEMRRVFPSAWPIASKVKPIRQLAALRCVNEYSDQTVSVFLFNLVRYACIGNHLRIMLRQRNEDENTRP